VPAPELLGVRGGRLLEAGDGAFAEEKAKHARDGATAHGVPRLAPRLQDTLDQRLGDLLQVLVSAWLAQNLQRLDACATGQPTSRQNFPSTPT
jgi:uncharacterized protein YfaQ (DUF2300 family)